MLNNTFTAYTLIPLVVILVLASLLLLKFGRVSLAKKHILLITGITLGLVGLSLFISTSDFSGTGIATKYGWPHFFYQMWESTEDSSASGSFSFVYLALNILFVGGFVTFVTALTVKLLNATRLAKSIH